MKKLHFWLVILMALVGCKSRNQQAGFEITGNIDHPEDSLVLVTYKGHTDTVQLDSGLFSFILPMTEPGYFEVRHGQANYQVFGAPGLSAGISFDYSSPEQLPAFTGPLAGENTYVAERTNFDNQQIDLENSLYTSLESEFMALNDSLRQLRTQQLEESRDDFTSEVAETFIQLETELIRTKWINRYLEYELYFPYLSGFADYKPSARFLEYRRQLDPDQEDLLVLDEYIGMLEYYIEVEKKSLNTEDLGLQSNEKALSLQFELIDKLISNQKVREEVKYRSVEEYIQVRGIEGLEQFFTNYIATVKDPVKKSELEKAFGKWAHMKTGSPAPEITGLKLDGSAFSSSALRGKVIYVGFWASSSHPSVEEMLKFNDLAEELEGERVAFLGVSVDTDINSWKKTVMLAGFQGTHIFGDQDYIEAEFNVQTIPRFMLIDREGKILSSNAEKPGEEMKNRLKALREGA